ncbi:MAG: ligase-associated DNA damage response exonuclease [Alphaproteobacteria bacterium]|nr:ligase-associated DNA damage response exonuclease [Alphaproteobacteria bacterium]
MSDPARGGHWIRPTPTGLYVEPGDFYIDPGRPVGRAVISHGHSDHARSGHDHVLATRETLAIMAGRHGQDCAGAMQAVAYGESLVIGGVTLRLAPAGHILGSAQIVLEHAGQRIVVSGDYKRRPDPTCPPFEAVPCDVFITEATFGLPVFRHPPDRDEIAKLLATAALFPERAMLVGVYALGKCQRVIALLRQAGYDKPIFLHGQLGAMCDVYRRCGVELGELRPVIGMIKEGLAGAIVLAPPGAAAERWARRLPEPLVAQASGWMRVKQRAKQSGVELPLVISDHADWDELLQTIDEIEAPEIWVTHGREEALVHAAKARGRKARALALVGYDEEGS